MLTGLSCTSKAEEPLDPNPSDDIFTIHRVFDDLDADRKNNSTGFENIAKNEEPRKFIGEITEIEGSRLYFHVVGRAFARDDYAVCDFLTEAPLTSKSVNLDSVVIVSGDVTDLPGRSVLWQLTGRKLSMTRCNFL